MQVTLKMLRAGKNLKQTDMAVALGVSRKTIAAWESGKTMPKVDKIEAICAFFGVSYDSIKWSA